ncbi:YihY/virulence factor BrkB family protein [Phycicoccus sp. 3266]|uniref:YihY/virulence factor BrkB family protein n=1 Tax=Phycicoccus sp. 3266 TaxID=2817751 RepID=UPI00285B203E|nr:YihY/virulence factor BrkB family protein [Phycicoccus sp. 3266]MDR6864655.1 membrane protein [Phycicoccus sp. 3266]
MSVRARLRRTLVRVPGGLQVARLTVETVRVCMKYRVTGLASEAGFFMLLSLPPLLIGLIGGVGYVGQWLGEDIVERVILGIQQFSSRFLVASVVDDTILPTVREVLKNGRGDLISIGFLLSIWSGSRALNVFVDTISIMYGQSGVRGIVRTRALSLTLYFLSLLVGIVIVPLVVIGPAVVNDLLPEQVRFLTWLYWPVVGVGAVASIATLFHISTPRRTPWLRDVPGAALTLVIWVVASFVVRETVTASIRGGTSIYGPLSAPIVLLIFLYALAIAILIGAALNAAVRRLWPVEERPSLRAQTVEWVRDRVAETRGVDTGGAVPAAGGAERRGVRRARRRLTARARVQHDQEALSSSVAGLRAAARGPLTPMQGEAGEPTTEERSREDDRHGARDPLGSRSK